MDSIQSALKEGDPHRAAELLAGRLKTAACTDDLLLLEKRLRSLPLEPFFEQGYLRKRIAVLSGYSTQFLNPLLKMQLFKSRIIADIYDPGFGLYEQAIYAKSEELRSFKPDLVYFCVGTDHIAQFEDESRETERWKSLWSLTRDFLGCEIIQNTFEAPLHRPLGNLEVKWPGSRTRFIQRLNLSLADSAPSFTHFNDVDFLAAREGRKTWRDERLYDFSKLPASYENHSVYAESIAAVAGGVFGRSKKCLVLDLDNTLWGGVIGDDGLTGIEIGEGSGTGEAFKRFQSYIKALKNRGVILAVCSKNEESTAKEPFQKRGEMIFKLEDISCFVANWEPKSKNIAEIARTLNIGLDALVFVDDNPAEREIVRRELPQVTVLDLPEDPANYTLALSSCTAFETPALTQEDLKRTEQYRANAERSKIESAVGNYQDYLRSLEMKAAIDSFESQSIPRIAQLINKTNQFNLTTRRYTESDVKRFAETSSYLTFSARLKDRFGDNGLISVFIGECRGDLLSIDTWLMSCRVLKRNLEKLLFRQVVSSARDRGISSIGGTYIPTEKNKLVENLLPELGFREAGRLEGGTTQWRFDLRDPRLVDKVLDEDLCIQLVPGGEY